MPRVNPGETRSHYLARCIPMVMGEGLTQKQAIGKCEGMYDDAAHKKETNMKIIHEGFDPDSIVGYRDQILFKKALSKELGYPYTGKYENKRNELPIYFDSTAMVDSSNDKTILAGALSGDKTYQQLKSFIIKHLKANKNRLIKAGYKWPLVFRD